MGEGFLKVFRKTMWVGFLSENDVICLFVCLCVCVGTKCFSRYGVSCQLVTDWRHPGHIWWG